MGSYILKRCCYFVVNLFIIITITFFLEHCLTGDFFSINEKLPQNIIFVLEDKYGLNKPVFEQYKIYMTNLMHGDLGISYANPNTTVVELIKRGLPASARLGLQILTFGLIVGTFLGVITAMYNKMWLNNSTTFFVTLLVSVPGFVIAVVAQKYLGRLIVPYGWNGPSLFFPEFKYTIIPTLVGSLGVIAGQTRFMRVQVLDIINSDYVTLGKSKGLSQPRLMWKHVLRNASIPLITSIPPSIAGMLCGSYAIERIYGIPGVGKTFLYCISMRDYPVVFGTTLFYTVLFMFSLLCVDILYGVVDPRIKVWKNKSK